VMKRNLIFILILLSYHWILAQENFPVNGVQDKRPGIFALINATLFTDYQTRLEKAVMIIEDGYIKEIGTDVTIPDGVVKIDLEGLYIYPGLIDLYSDYGMPEIKKRTGSSVSPQYDSDREEGAFGWNDAIHSDFKAVNVIDLSSEKAKKLREQGICSVLSQHPDGIVRGSSVLVNLLDEPVQEAVVISEAAAHYSFDKGSSTQEYPTSKMGAVALLRQTYYDAEWYQSKLNEKQINLSLQYFNELQSLPQIFEAKDKTDIMLIGEIGKEFNVPFIVKGSGNEYQRIREISQARIPLILPVNFPDAYDVANPDDAVNVSLEQMKHWELAPANLSIVDSAGIPFALTSCGLEDLDDFLKNIRKAIRYGLPESAALKALTDTPARLIRADNRIGSLKKGKYANLLITSDSLFKEDMVIYENWIMGRRYIIHDLHVKGLKGKYELKLDGKTYLLEISNKKGLPKADIYQNDTVKMKTKVDFSDGNIFLSFDTGKQKSTGYRLTGWEEKQGFSGEGYRSDGTVIAWHARHKGPLAKDTVITESKKDSLSLGKIIYPFVAFGWIQKPESKRVLFKNATVWTNEEEEIMFNTDVLVDDGKIIQIGKRLETDNARVIDATGKHLTSGIIDEHSHIALKSVNEMAQSITSEVRMKDVLDPTDIDIYRQLAGGVTAAQLLHGSANVIGGQSALIKFRWGNDASGLLIDGAAPFIKFALGENVKQSNWGPRYTIRYPQTRMGVEQVIVDGFTRARTYQQALVTYEKLNKKEKEKTSSPRRDLELEALAEILDHRRFITCHSYVQSEINMLINVAEQFGFTVNTFTHILEGYKVADRMLKHGAGGSTFSDWWAYKYEVRDAIPYNAALMNQVGVVTAINSDDAEMARRLNQEAAKTVKYGGVSEEDAWKMVTLNPAKLLHLDHRMGSIRVGKDADLVLWSDNPLSIYARVEKTMVDGIFYYDIDKDRETREWISRERARLIGKMTEARNKGEKTQKAEKKITHLWHCDDFFNDEF
jgi:imidazolonepropionase-like amidohydrolase